MIDMKSFLFLLFVGLSSATLGMTECFGQTYSIEAGESFTIGLKIDSSYTIGNLEDLQLNIGRYDALYLSSSSSPNASDSIFTTADDYIFRAQLTSSYTAAMRYSSEMYLTVRDAVLGVKKIYLGSLSIVRSSSGFSNSDVNEGYDLLVDLTIAAGGLSATNSWITLQKGETGATGPAGADGSNAETFTGWADYTDTTYTVSSPFSLTGGVKYTLYNHADIIRDSQLPSDVDSVYSRSDSTILGFNGDGWNILIEFKIKPTTATVTRVTVTIDIGGSVGEIYPRDLVLSKGNGEEHYYVSSFAAYTLNTWETNGGKVKVQTNAAAEIYDVRYVLTRTHKAREGWVWVLLIVFIRRKQSFI